MEKFWEFAKLFLIINASLLGLFLILLALPKSRLRNFALKIFGIFSYSITGLMVLYIINPADLLPDLLPIIGQMDDAAAVVGAILSGLTGWLSMRKARASLHD